MDNDERVLMIIIGFVLGILFTVGCHILFD